MTTFDHHVTDQDNRARIDVTRSQTCEDFVLLNLQPFNRPWPRTTVIISLDAATELAQALLDAVAAFSVVPDGWKAVETEIDWKTPAGPGRGAG